MSIIISLIGVKPPPKSGQRLFIPKIIELLPPVDSFVKAKDIPSAFAEIIKQGGGRTVARKLFFNIPRQYSEKFAEIIPSFALEAIISNLTQDAANMIKNLIVSGSSLKNQGPNLLEALLTPSLETLEVLPPAIQTLLKEGIAKEFPILFTTIQNAVNSQQNGALGVVRLSDLLEQNPEDKILNRFRLLLNLQKTLNQQSLAKQEASLATATSAEKKTIEKDIRRLQSFIAQDTDPVLYSNKIAPKSVKQLITSPSTETFLAQNPDLRLVLKEKNPILIALLSKIPTKVQKQILKIVPKEGLLAILARITSEDIQQVLNFIKEQPTKQWLQLIAIVRNPTLENLQKLPPKLRVSVQLGLLEEYKILFKGLQVAARTEALQIERQETAVIKLNDLQLTQSVKASVERLQALSTIQFLALQTEFCRITDALLVLETAEPKKKGYQRRRNELLQQRQDVQLLIEQFQNPILYKSVSVSSTNRFG